MDNQIDYSENQKLYSEKSFFKKIRSNFSKIGYNLLNKAFVLYYVARDKDTPTWAKSIIYGALGYLILPLDAIPDIVPFIGFSDDLTAIVSAISVIIAHIKPEHIKQADDRINKFISNT